MADDLTTRRLQACAGLTSPEVFRPPIPVPGDAEVVADLVAMLGRDPAWRAGRRGRPRQPAPVVGAPGPAWEQRWTIRSPRPAIGRTDNANDSPSTRARQDVNGP